MEKIELLIDGVNTFELEDYDTTEMLSLWGLPSFYSEEDEMKYAKKLASLTRATPEYKQWVKYLKETMGYNYCVYTKETYDTGSTIEIHHYPLVLSDIIIIAMDNLLIEYKDDRTKISSLMVVEKVLKWHYEMKVGVVPLIKTLHEKFHNTKFLIPKEWVIGDWLKLFEENHIRDGFKLIKETALSCSVNNFNIQKVDWPGL